MKYFLALATLAASALAQRISLVSPVAGSTVPYSQPLVVDIKQELSSGILDQIGLIIGLKECDDGACSSDPVTGTPSTILYNGTYNPQPDFNNPQNGFHQKFSFNVPAGVSGPSILSVVHFLAVDAGLTPLVEFTGVTFTVQ